MSTTNHRFTWCCLLFFNLVVKQLDAWDYHRNGADWGAMGQCGVGSQQSPIDVPQSATVTKDLRVFLRYPHIGAPLQLYNNGHSIALTLPEIYKGGFGLGVDEKDFLRDNASAYRLWQVNFHAPSEHTLNGERMPLEMQMMHQRVTGGGPETAVVVVLFTDAANVYNDFLEALLTNGLPRKPWEETSVNAGSSPPVSFTNVVGGSPFYHYVGSLTVPPCESNVKYYLRQDPIPAAHAQLRRFAKILKHTCGPQGNFRILHTMASKLVLMPSVDQFANPGVIVNPKVSPTDDKGGGDDGITANSGSIAQTKSAAKDCSPSIWDTVVTDRDTFLVGEPQYVSDAKVRHRDAQRALQVAHQALDYAHRNREFQQRLYDNAPGWVEKINLKWKLDNAKTMEAQAKVGVQKLEGSQKKPEKDLMQAIIRWCNERNIQIQNGQADALALEPTSANPKEGSTQASPWVYPDPQVTLPRGLSASPFTVTGASAVDPNGKGMDGMKIAPDLHTPDAPPSQSVKASVKTNTGKGKEKEPIQSMTLRIELPIPMGSIGDENLFKQNLVNALANASNALPGTFNVSNVTNHTLQAVNVGMESLSQVAIRPSSRSNQGFLQASHAHRTRGQSTHGHTALTRGFW